MTIYAVVFNVSNNSVRIDQAGRVVAPQEWAAVVLSYVQNQINRGRLLVADHAAITRMSAPNAWEAKQEYVRLVAAEDEPDEQPRAKSMTDYDEAETVPAKRSRGSATKDNKSAT